MAEIFDDSRLDDELLLKRADGLLRPLAEAGSRVRRDASYAAEAIEAAVADLSDDSRPRAVVAAGPDSRLLRAVLEPWCPVPFVAWPGPSLPGWVGALDLVVVLAPDGGDIDTASAVAEAVRRGCRLVVATAPDSLVARHAVGRDALILPASSGDQLALAVVMLELLDRLHLGPSTVPEAVAAALDEVAVSCSPHRDLSVNPAKMLAMALAESTPLVWGGSVLAARAARRIAESMRRSTGRAALAGDAVHLLPVLAASHPRDLFADPFADAPGDGDPRPVLVVLEDGSADPSVLEKRGRLLAAAEQHDVRVEVVPTEDSEDVAKYASLLSTGTYAAAYLCVGLGRV